MAKKPPGTVNMVITNCDEKIANLFKEICTMMELERGEVFKSYMEPFFRDALREIELGGADGLMMDQLSDELDDLYKV